MTLTPALSDTLVKIYEHPGGDVSRLARHLGLSTCAARFRVRQLIAAGWVRTRAPLRKRPGQRRPSLLLEPVWPAAVMIGGDLCRLVLLDPPTPEVTP